VLRAVAYGESDVIVTLLTESHGKLGVLVRGGRKSSKRVGGALEPFHSIAVSIDDQGRELGTLREARLVTLRQRLVGDLDALDAGGRALRWVRQLFPARTPEPAGWATLNGLLDALERGEAPRPLLAGAALRLLADVGYALDFERCVKCGKPCPEGKPAYVDAARGGLVCRACGGSARTIGAKTRAIAIALARGEAAALADGEADEILGIAEDAMAAHAGIEG
jgi:DNA repair protein RecO (recombination protein O)